MIFFVLNFRCQAIETLLVTSEGDMRKAITTLQSTARLKAGEKITKQDVTEIAGVCGHSLHIHLLSLHCRFLVLAETT